MKHAELIAAICSNLMIFTLAIGVPLLIGRFLISRGKQQKNDNAHLDEKISQKADNLLGNWMVLVGIVSLILGCLGVFSLLVRQMNNKATNWIIYVEVSDFFDRVGTVYV